MLIFGYYALVERCLGLFHVRQVIPPVFDNNDNKHTTTTTTTTATTTATTTTTTATTTTTTATTTTNNNDTNKNCRFLGRVGPRVGPVGRALWARRRRVQRR